MFTIETVGFLIRFQTIPQMDCGIILNSIPFDLFIFLMQPASLYPFLSLCRVAISELVRAGAVCP